MMGKFPKLEFFGILLFIVSLFVVVFTEQASATICDFEKSPVEFVFEEWRSDVTLDHSKSSAEIGQLSMGLGGKDFLEKINKQADDSKIKLNRFNTEGLTHGPAGAHVKLSYNEKKVTDKSYCVYIKKAVLGFGFQKMLVYVSRQYAKNSCRYGVILDHEYEHVKRSNDVLTRFIPPLEKLNDFVKTTPIRNGVDNEAIQQNLLDEFLVKIREIVSKFDHELSVENGKLDTIERYRYETTLCPKSKS
ncbi:MAG: hypothetical protein COB29_12730 [Sulfitobacter sp.]|nr:MAG: hypothetical protein COB29_12730 [Sulfitobacter sp.]